MKNLRFAVLLGLVSGALQAAPEFEEEFEFEKDSIASTYLLRAEQVGYAVFDLNSGEILEAQNLNELFIPASVTKTLTFSANAENYAVSHKRKTQLYYSGQLNRGRLFGNLHLVGGLQEDLQLKDLDGFARRARAMGIREVFGNLYYDERASKSLSQISPIFGDNHTYNQSFSALSIENNLLKFKLTRSGSSWNIDGENFSESIRALLDYDMDREAEDSVWEWRSEDSGVWRINASKLDPTKNQLEFIVPNKLPARYAAEKLFESLDSFGVELRGSIRATNGSSERRLQLITQSQSKDLKEFTAHTLLTSNNLFAELAGVLLAQKLSRGFRGGILESGALLESYWKKQAGIGDGELILKNGSGLTPYNWMSPSAMRKALLKMWSQEMSDGTRFAELWHHTDLTQLKDFENTASTCTSMWSKSGYLSYVRGLAGFFCSKSGGVLGFAVFLNDIGAREILNSKGSHPDFERVEAQSDAWAEESRQLRSDLLRAWIARH